MITINESIVSKLSELKEFRHDMHKHPELCYEEERASKKVVEVMQSLLGIGQLTPTVEKSKKSNAPFLFGENERGSIHKGMGGTGVVVTIFGKGFSKANTGPTVGIRADMDALPIEERTGLTYQSSHKGKMHACGHDGHTTMVVGGAMLLSDPNRLDELKGTVHLIFQPAEEGGAGAEAMMDDGLFQRFPCSAVFALHNWPQLNVGQMAVRVGAIMAGSMRFNITIKGKGGHAAMPHLCVDPLPVAGALLTNAQQIVSRMVDPLDSAVVTFGIVQGGTVENIIPSEVHLAGTVRYLKKETESRVLAALEKLVKQLSAAHGCEGTFTGHPGYPPTTNTAHEAAFMAKVMAECVGVDNHNPSIEAAMTAEDFGFMLEATPGAYGWMGNAKVASASSSSSSSCPPANCSVGLHNPHYDFNDDSIPIGATFWDALARRWLSDGVKGQTQGPSAQAKL